jgi:hypothetical protein
VINATLIGSRALSQLHSDSMGTCTGVRPSNSLAVHCLDHGRLLAVDDPLTSSYATNALLPMSDKSFQGKIPQGVGAVHATASGGALGVRAG